MARAPPPKNLLKRAQVTLALLRHFPRTAALVWESTPALAILLLVVLLTAALIPVSTAWVGKLIVDAVVSAAQLGQTAASTRVLKLIGLELCLMLLSMVLTRAQILLRQLLEASLGNHVSMLVLRKALTLEMRHFEDADFYDNLQRARVEASIRPLSMVLQIAGLLQSAVTIATFTVVLARLSIWSVLVIAAAAFPAFLAEARFSGDVFRMRWARAGEARRRTYLELLLTRDEFVKEVKLLDLGPLLLARFRALFAKFYAEDRALALRRTMVGLLLASLSLLAFYGSYLLMAREASAATITLGDLALYVSVFRQGQDALQSMLTSLGGLYEDGLFMAALFSYLDIETSGDAARVAPPLRAAVGPQAIEFRDVSFRYPGKEAWVLRGFNLTIAAGEKVALCGENGSGKSTLVKLLLRLHDPTEGAILYGGVDLRDMDPTELRSRLGVTFQDFAHYQFTVAENVGLGWVQHIDDRQRIELAVERAGAREMVGHLPHGLETMLGGWFIEGQELSGGQWQKIALARAFMREAEALILDEPSAALDAEAEHALFQRLRQLAEGKSALWISHRFSTLRLADRIALLRDGHIEELGSHDALVAKQGRYAELFRLQASGYQPQGPATIFEMSGP